jgi:hypothetical protein
MVATAAQIAANRANARRSTGPRTPEGKAASSRNALTHGAHASDDTILATSADTYLDDFRAHFQPADALEAHLVAHLAVLASRRDRLNAAMDALLELNERHALIEHLHERYGRNNPNAFIDGQPSWQAALRRYDGNTYIDDRFPEPASDPALDPDPILCSLAYTLSGPRAAALFRHEASVDRRFTATLKELTALQARRRDAAAPPPPAGPLFEPRLQRALDAHLRREAGAPSSPPAAEALMAPIESTPCDRPLPLAHPSHDRQSAPPPVVAPTAPPADHATPSAGATPLVPAAMPLAPAALPSRPLPTTATLSPRTPARPDRQNEATAGPIADRAGLAQRLLAGLTPDAAGFYSDLLSDLLPPSGQNSQFEANPGALDHTAPRAAAIPRP